MWAPVFKVFNVFSVENRIVGDQKLQRLVQAGSKSRALLFVMAKKIFEILLLLHLTH
jgi:hypothetical protein